MYMYLLFLYKSVFYCFFFCSLSLVKNFQNCRTNSINRKPHRKVTFVQNSNQNSCKPWVSLIWLWTTWPWWCCDVTLLGIFNQLLNFVTVRINSSIQMLGSNPIKTPNALLVCQISCFIISGGRTENTANIKPSYYDSLTEYCSETGCSFAHHFAMLVFWLAVCSEQVAIQISNCCLSKRFSILEYCELIENCSCCLKYAFIHLKQNSQELNSGL